MLGKASETMVELCLWPSIVLLRKLAIWNLVFTGSYKNIGIVLRMGFYVRELQYGKIVHSLSVGWRNFFPVVLLCQFLVLAGNRFWFYILAYLKYNTVVALC